MQETKQVTCIVCPIGCKILVRKDDSICEVLEGNKCKKGLEYAIHETLDPRRLLTSSVLVKDGEWPLVSVKSSKPVPKEKIFIVLKELKKIYVFAPVYLGDVIIRNVADSDIDIIATKNINKKINI